MQYKKNCDKTYTNADNAQNYVHPRKIKLIKYLNINGFVYVDLYLYVICIDSVLQGPRKH